MQKVSQATPVARARCPTNLRQHPAYWRTAASLLLLCDIARNLDLSPKTSEHLCTPRCSSACRAPSFRTDQHSLLPTHLLSTVKYFLLHCKTRLNGLTTRTLFMLGIRTRLLAKYLPMQHRALCGSSIAFPRPCACFSPASAVLETIISNECSILSIIASGNLV